VNSTNSQIAEAFSRHDFAATYPHMADDIRWTVVGDRVIAGRDGVIAACTESAGFLSAMTTTFRSFRVIADADHVVTDSTAEYADADGESSIVASCDIYAFTGGVLREITSYTVEVSD
jgi:ketosteroid isomerase-like protein